MRRLLAAVVLLLIAACATRDVTPAERLSGGIKATESAKTFHFTLDGTGQVTRAEAAQDLNFTSTGEVAFPDAVHMVITIDQPNGGVRSELRQSKGIVYIRPDAKSRWQRSQGHVELAGFDPLAAMNFAELKKTRVAVDAGLGLDDGVAVHKIKLEPKEAFRKQIESRLPAGFEDTTLGISTEMWLEIKTNRIVRVVQRYDYKGGTRGFFETVLRLEKFGASVDVAAPRGDEVSNQPLILPSIAPRRR